ncbi:MAG: hypothetical protein ACRC1K_07960, partial [Planctomycetia bacterium]
MQLPSSDTERAAAILADAVYHVSKESGLTFVDALDVVLTDDPDVTQGSGVESAAPPPSQPRPPSDDP